MSGNEPRQIIRRFFVVLRRNGRERGLAGEGEVRVRRKSVDIIGIETEDEAEEKGCIEGEGR